MQTRIRLVRVVLAGLLVLAGSTPGLASATFEIINGNSPDTDFASEGFNNTTVAVPVGGNTGTTLGQQRLVAFQRAAEIWGEALDSPIPIKVFVYFRDLGCEAGAAGPSYLFSNFLATGAFPGPVAPNTWHHSALADKRAGVDFGAGLVSEIFVGKPPRDIGDIVVYLDINIDQGSCGSQRFYYGLDGNEGPNQIDFVSLVLHELAHGLGFSQFTNPTTGERMFPIGGGGGDVFGAHLVHSLTNVRWDAMSSTERLDSLASGSLVWDGVDVVSAVPDVLTAGADGQKRVFVKIAANPGKPDTPLAHWSPDTAPNQLMESPISSDLAGPGVPHSVRAPRDLTLALMRDIGWYADEDSDGLQDGFDLCAGSNRSPTIAVNGINTGVANRVLISGCSMADEIAKAATAARNHGAFVSAVAHLTNIWRREGLLVNTERAKIQRAAARSRVGK